MFWEIIIQICRLLMWILQEFNEKNSDDLWDPVKQNYHAELKRNSVLQKYYKHWNSNPLIFNLICKDTSGPIQILLEFGFFLDDLLEKEWRVACNFWICGCRARNRKVQTLFLWSIWLFFHLENATDSSCPEKKNSSAERSGIPSVNSWI